MRRPASSSGRNRRRRWNRSFHTAQSALVDRGLVILHVGGHNQGALTAFDAATGAVKWAWDGDGPGYGSPILAEFGGTRQVIVFSQENLVGVDAANGQLLWRVPFVARSITNSITPLVYGQTVIVSGQGKPLTAYTISKRAASASPSTVGAWNRARSGSSMPSKVRMREVSRVASSE